MEQDLKDFLLGKVFPLKEVWDDTTYHLLESHELTCFNGYNLESPESDSNISLNPSWTGKIFNFIGEHILRGTFEKFDKLGDVVKIFSNILEDDTQDPHMIVEIKDTGTIDISITTDSDNDYIVFPPNFPGDCELTQTMLLEIFLEDYSVESLIGFQGSYQDNISIIKDYFNIPEGEQSGAESISTDQYIQDRQAGDYILIKNSDSFVFK